MAGTVGFQAKDRITGKYGIVTAGHVVNELDKAVYNSKSEILGQCSKTKKSGGIDAAFIPFSSKYLSRWTVSTMLPESLFNGDDFTELKSNSLSVIHSVAEGSYIVENAKTVRYGIMTGKTEGRILYTSASVAVKNSAGEIQMKHSDMVGVSRKGVKGESGGPVGLSSASSASKSFELIDSSS